MTDLRSVMVLGARVGTGNIGEAILNTMDDAGWTVGWHSCQMDQGHYDIPDGFEGLLEDYDALVVTLGKEGITPFLTCTDDDIAEVVYGSLVLPLRAIRAWVQARGERGGKCVVIGSYAYDHAPTACAPYCAAKAGLAQAIVELGWELTAQDYSFHIVHPYHVPSTPMGGRVVKAMMEERGFGLEEAHEYQKKDMRLQEHLAPIDVAEVVRWLLETPVGPWLSGQGINLYGGVR